MNCLPVFLVVGHARRILRFPLHLLLQRRLLGSPSPSALPLLLLPDPPHLLLEQGVPGADLEGARSHRHLPVPDALQGLVHVVLAPERVYVRRLSVGGGATLLLFGERLWQSLDGQDELAEVAVQGGLTEFFSGMEVFDV